LTSRVDAISSSLVSVRSSNTQFDVVEHVELQVRVPQNEHAYSRSHLSFLDLYTTSHPAGGVQVLQKAWDLVSDDAKDIIRIAEFNLDAPFKRG
jgi:hypothetical protein